MPDVIPQWASKQSQRGWCVFAPIVPQRVQVGTIQTAVCVAHKEANEELICLCYWCEVTLHVVVLPASPCPPLWIYSCRRPCAACSHEAMGEVRLHGLQICILSTFSKQTSWMEENLQQKCHLGKLHLEPSPWMWHASVLWSHGWKIYNFLNVGNPFTARLIGLRLKHLITTGKEMSKLVWADVARRQHSSGSGLRNMMERRLVEDNKWHTPTPRLPFARTRSW